MCDYSSLSHCLVSCRCLFRIRVCWAHNHTNSHTPHSTLQFSTLHTDIDISEIKGADYEWGGKYDQARTLIIIIWRVFSTQIQLVCMCAKWIIRLILQCILYVHDWVAGLGHGQGRAQGKVDGYFSQLHNLVTYIIIIMLCCCMFKCCRLQVKVENFSLINQFPWVQY